MVIREFPSPGGWGLGGGILQVSPPPNLPHQRGRNIHSTKQLVSPKCLTVLGQLFGQPFGQRFPIVGVQNDEILLAVDCLGP